MTHVVYDFRCRNLDWLNRFEKNDEVHKVYAKPSKLVQN